MGVNILRNKVSNKIDELHNVDLVVGIPSLNNALTIGGIVKTFAEGIKKYSKERNK